MPPLWDFPDTLAIAVITAQGAVLTVLVAFVGHMLHRLTDLEANQRSLWEARERDAVTKRVLGDHLDVLEAHIWGGADPPPPARPPGA